MHYTERNAEIETRLTNLRQENEELKAVIRKREALNSE
jgi:hypothetical protein